MHYLITGGAGFIGSHLAQRLAEKGHQITILDNFSIDSPVVFSHGNIEVVRGDVSNKELVDKLASESDYIIHLAAVVGVRLAMKKGREGIRVSYLGTDNVLEVATEQAKKIFIASSSAVYGKIQHSPVTEGDDSLLGSSQKPCWLYSVAKLMEEHLALAYFRELGTQVVLGRFFNVIGPHQTGAYGMVVPTFIKKALLNEPIVVYGSGQQTRTFAYIEDILDGLELVLNKGEYGKVYNIGGQTEVTIMALAEKIKELTASDSPIVLLPYRQAFGPDFEETLQRKPDISLLKSLGYEPQYSLEHALSQIIKYHLSKSE